MNEGNIEIVQKKPAPRSPFESWSSKTNYEMPGEEGENHRITLVAEEMDQATETAKQNLQAADEFGFLVRDYPLKNWIEGGKKRLTVIKQEASRAIDKFQAIPEHKRIGLLTLAALDHEMNHYYQFKRYEQAKEVVFARELRRLFASNEGIIRTSEGEGLLELFVKYRTLQELGSRIAEFSFANNISSEVSSEDEELMVQVRMTSMVASFINREYGTDYEGQPFKSRLESIINDIKEKNLSSLTRRVHTLAEIILLTGKFDLLDIVDGPDTTKLVEEVINGLEEVYFRPKEFLERIRGEKTQEAIKDNFEGVAIRMVAQIKSVENSLKPKE